MEFRILGPLEVLDEAGERVVVPGSRERVLLALMLLSANRVVSSERLVDGLWGDRPPDGAGHALQVHVSRLRQALRQGGGDGLLVTRPPGYLLRIDPAAFDAARFEALLGQGRHEASRGDQHRAAVTLREALRLWRGPALADVADAPLVRGEAARLEEARVAALEERVEADLACGRHAELVAELDAVSRAHPLRERLWGQRMVALYRAGRQADALRAYQELRTALGEGLGLEPSSTLQRLESAILRHEPELDWQPDATGPPPPAIPMPVLLTDIGRVFAGRERELEQLDALWVDAATGGQRLALLSGEPGVGKTRLAAEFATRVNAEGATVLAGGCDEDLGVPYQPFVEALGHFVDHTPTPLLAPGLGRHAGELVRIHPDLAGRLPGLAPPLRSDPETERYRLFDAVAAWLGAVAGQGSLLLVLDDLQWAAKPTLLLLRHVVRSAACRRLLVVGTYRDTELGPGHPLGELLADLRRDKGAERLALSGLGEAEVQAVMERAAGHALDEEERALVRAIHQETEGIPFFVWEFVRHLAETGGMAQRDGHWVAQRLEVGLPEGVRDVVGRRLARLSDPTNRVLSSAAVLGADFQVGALEAVCGLEEGDLIAALDEAAAARLVVETGVDAYRFVHALVRSALDEGLSASRRARLHLRAADACEDDVPRLAHHLLACAPLAEATRTARACLTAGDRALTVLADAEAADWYTKGLTFAENDPGLRIDLLTGLGEAQRRTGDAASRQTLLDASGLAAHHGDLARLVRAVLANNRGFFSSSGAVDDERLELIDTALDLVGPNPSAERAEILALQASELLFAGGHERRLRIADEAGAIAAQLDDVAVQARVGLRRLWACLVPDRWIALAVEGRWVVGCADATGDPQLRALSRTAWALALLSAGELGETRRCMHEAMAIAEESGQPGLRCLARFYYASAVDTLGDHDEAERIIQATVELGQQAGWPDVVMWYGAAMQLRWAFGGQPDVATAVAAAAFAEFPAMVTWQGTWAANLGLAGRDEELTGILASLPVVLPRIPVDLFWLNAHFSFVAAQGFGVEDPGTAADLYDRLLPYRHLHAAYGVGYWGPIEMALAVAARVIGDIDAALAHHEAAAATIEASGAARARAFNGYQWVVTLLARDAPGDRRRASELHQQTLEWCAARGYMTFVKKLEELRV